MREVIASLSTPIIVFMILMLIWERLLAVFSFALNFIRDQIQ